MILNSIYPSLAAVAYKMASNTLLEEVFQEFVFSSYASSLIILSEYNCPLGKAGCFRIAGAVGA